MYIVLATTSSQYALFGAIIGAAGAISAPAVSHLITYFSEKRERRRQLFSEAFKAALAWQELLYRVRRRSQGDKKDLILRFHDAQESIDFYTGWIGSESQYMQRSYASLVQKVKRSTETLIQTAWEADPEPDDDHARSLESLPRPIINDDRDAFLKDVRGYLAPILSCRRITVRWRNRVRFRRKK